LDNQKFKHKKNAASVYLCFSISSIPNGANAAGKPLKWRIAKGIPTMESAQNVPKTIRVTAMVQPQTSAKVTLVIKSCVVKMDLKSSPRATFPSSVAAATLNNEGGEYSHGLVVVDGPCWQLPVVGLLATIASLSKG